MDVVVIAAGRGGGEGFKDLLSQKRQKKREDTRPQRSNVRPMRSSHQSKIQTNVEKPKLKVACETVQKKVTVSEDNSLERNPSRRSEFACY